MSLRCSIAALGPYWARDTITAQFPLYSGQGYRCARRLELEFGKEFLNAHVAGRSVTRAAVLRPVVPRSLVEDDFADDVVGRVFGRTERRGKVLLLPLEPERMLVLQPMLTGVLQYCAPEVTVAKRTFSPSVCRYGGDGPSVHG